MRFIEINHIWGNIITYSAAGPQGGVNLVTSLHVLRGQNISFFLYFMFPRPINHLINSFNIPSSFFHNKTNHFLSL
jgi:hypothetical protein